MAAGARLLFPGAAKAGVLEVPVEATRPDTRGQPFTKGFYVLDPHTHANHVGANQLPTTSALEVMLEYHRIGVNAVVLTNLLEFLDVSGVAGLLNRQGAFLVIQGEEPSTSQGIPSTTPIYDSLGLGTTGPVDNAKANQGRNVREVWTNQAHAIQAVNGLAVAAHMNMGWVAKPADVALSDPGGHNRYMELINGESGTNAYGGGGFPSTWQALIQAQTLSLRRGRRRRVLPLNGSDCHHVRAEHRGLSSRGDEPLALAGTAYNIVRAPELSWKALRTALEAGDYYCVARNAMGVYMDDFDYSSTGIRLTLNPDANDLGWFRRKRGPGSSQERWRTWFFTQGDGSKPAREDTSDRPEYRLRPGDGFVGAYGRSSDGDEFWTPLVLAG
jgi:hypothetical protein